MGFVKHGNGEINGIIKTDELTEEQKKTVKNRKVEAEVSLDDVKVEKKGEAN